MKMIWDALTYPVRGSGWIMILLGTVLSLLLDIGSYSPIFGSVALLFSGGYFVAFYFEIITSTLNRSTDCADWPSLSSPFELLSPIFRFYGALLVSFLPALVCILWFREDMDEPSPALLACVAFGGLYFPMSLLGIVQFGGISGLMPHVVLPAIFRCLPGYLLAMAGLALVVAVPMLAEHWTSSIRYLHWIITPALSLYGLMAQARFLGLLYLKYEERIGWF